VEEKTPEQVLFKDSCLMRGLLLKPASEKVRILEVEPFFSLSNGDILRKSL